MPGPLEAAGAVKSPSKYAGLGMGARQFTGLVTQRSPLRDGAVPYLVGKFYGGTRFDTIIDGLNREISQRMTDVRAAGSAVYNSNIFPAGNSFYDWKYIQNNSEVIKVLYDSVGGEGTLDLISSAVVLNIEEGALGFITFSPNVKIQVGTEITFEGLTHLTELNGETYPVLSSSNGNAYFSVPGSTQVLLADETGTASGNVSSGSIYDATAGQQSIFLNKNSGSGPARFIGINTELFITDGVDQQKVLQGSQTWQPGVNILPGTLINEGANPGTLQMALGGITMSVVATEATGTNIIIYTDQTDVSEQFTNLVGVEATFSGLTAGSFLNGSTVPITGIPSTTLGAFTVASAHAFYAYTADTGSASTGDGTTGSSVPSFAATEFEVVSDSGQQWKCYGPALQEWTPIAPTAAPSLTPINGARFWKPNTILSQYYAILDTNGNIECALAVTANAGGIYKTGRSYPTWNVQAAAGSFANTIDGTIIWSNLGAAGSWAASTAFYTTPTALPGPSVAVILDSNQNLQWVSSGSGGTSGTTEPTWNDTIGGTTSDGALTWTCLGPGVPIASQSVQYASSYHGVDGSVSTASAPAYVQGGILGVTPTEDIALNGFIQINGPISADSQIDQIWIWRTPIGQATLVYEDAIPSDGILGSNFIYSEYGIPDVSSAGQGALNAFIAAPVAEANDPPPVGATAPVYYQQRIWMIYQNKVIYSGGPDTIVGNGNTAWPPLNEIPFAAQPIKLFPVLVENGGLIVITTSGIKIILGTGTSSNPYYVGDYLELVSLQGFTAACIAYNQIFCMESNGKVSAIAIEYPFNPQTGYTEVGFPIGDQFVKTTTGGVNAVLFNPATAYVSWNMNSSGDTGMYVSDGAGHWFRLSIINPPESGMLWSPLRTLEGGASAVQSVEVSPGVHRLLIAPATSGPILMRDTTGTVWTDNGTAYPSWDAKGATLLCETGDWVDVAHISTKSRAVGARPTISVLLNEIAPVEATPPNGPNASYTVLELDEKSQDPAIGRRSVSMYSDRYDLAQNGVNTQGDCLLTKFDYGTQAVGDELLDWGISAAPHSETEEQESK